jgi:ABC-2 type transport system ATP-binding protein
LHVLGRPVPADLPQLIPEVGALVETPLFFPSFSGRTNLRILGDVSGISTSRQEECLEIVGLRDRADDRFKSYSLGMKQRLGIAAALLKSPRLLILDEPSNGLDPAGIREVRELIRTLGAGGRTTVFLSSHLLTEVQQVCDHVSILARGHCVASGRVDDVLATGASDDVIVVLDPADAERGLDVLLGKGFQAISQPDGIRAREVGDPARVTRALADSGIYLRGLSPVTADLESVFLELTSDDAHDLTAGQVA